MTNEQAKCRFCGVLASHGHFDWCKVTRAPSPSEVMQAVIDEEGRCVGGEGPSSGLADMAKAALAALPAEPAAELHAGENRCVECYSYRQSGATECRNCGLKF